MCAVDSDRWVAANAARLRLEMAAAVAEEHELPPEWREVLGRVPRHLFLPDRVWECGHNDDGEHENVEVNRTSDPEQWLTLAYADDSVTVQFDGGPVGAPPAEDAAEEATCAISPPRVAADLAELQLKDGDRVLEVGTGTGYITALLAARLGEQNVVSIDIDPLLVEAATRSLGYAGLHPLVVCADASVGHAAGAPYDRVISTCAVQQVPYSWVEQTRPGGTIRVPRANAFLDYGEALLTVGGDGTASGRLLFPVRCTPMRGQAIAKDVLELADVDEADYRESSTELDPHDFGSADAITMLSVRFPDVHSGHDVAEDEDGVCEHWFMDAAGSSWASVTRREDASKHEVRQHGPRNLWDEVMAVYAWWQQVGEPAFHRFGLTVTPDRQFTWLDSPDAELTWDVPLLTAGAHS